jgi:hypothetical protein
VILEYSVVKYHGEWRLRLGNDLRGAFSTKEVALGAAHRAVQLARAEGHRARVVVIDKGPGVNSFAAANVGASAGGQDQRVAACAIAAGTATHDVPSMRRVRLAPGRPMGQAQ